MLVGMLILSETGSAPVSLKVLSLTGLFRDFYKFAEDWNNNNVLLVSTSIFYYCQIAQ